MKLTIAHLLVSIREILSDSYSDAYRWSDVTLIRFIYEGIVRITNIRPESKYVDFKLTEINIPIVNGSASEEKNKPFPIDDRWSSAIVHYACYRAFQLDESDTMNSSRANEHLNFFNTWSQL